MDDTHTRYAFIKASWHADVVDRALVGFRGMIPSDDFDVFDIPGAFEIPLVARDLARTGRYGAIIGAAFVVDGGIYRHDFVASTVVDGLMRAQMDADVPVLSAVLTPHNHQEPEAHDAFFRDHFELKGREAASAALALVKTRARRAA
ncbi:6,7-dimethyl-8-ribityllumazine synthase 2 [Defluviimonas aquaemixtae]|uniref:6,7-dimethyl-8-ribityllumazine synthase n=1 Tax=Albidovulum aquaemixtae TaxID=1542388 RepID=A0A2R8BJZ0_9RHOB|nr:6,7-dimethyl-8-ribityllumazine synthase [Defluviimonas aquaemixtae]SPH23721.1 6,7-dimethyl-8-ribityllumazine synthase 2 [Defluviimonas aquaemixtae]